MNRPQHLLILLPVTVEDGGKTKRTVVRAMYDSEICSGELVPVRPAFIEPRANIRQTDHISSPANGIR